MQPHELEATVKGLDAMKAYCEALRGYDSAQVNSEERIAAQLKDLSRDELNTLGNDLTDNLEDRLEQLAGLDDSHPNVTKVTDRYNAIPPSKDIEIDLPETKITLSRKSENGDDGVQYDIMIGDVESEEHLHTLVIDLQVDDADLIVLTHIFHFYPEDARAFFADTNPEKTEEVKALVGDLLDGQETITMIEKPAVSLRREPSISARF